MTDRTLVMDIDEPPDLPGGGVERTGRLKSLIMDFRRKVKPDLKGQILHAGTCGKSLNGKLRIEFRRISGRPGRPGHRVGQGQRSLQGALHCEPELWGWIPRPRGTNRAGDQHEGGGGEGQSRR